jgi:arylsulfatase A-like enzyme
MQGRDFSPLYLSEDDAELDPAWRDEFFYEHPTFKSVDFIPASEALVRKEWKYFYWPDFEREQLFNIKADPHEENDLVANPECAEKLAEMRQRFADLKQKAQ